MNLSSAVLKMDYFLLFEGVFIGVADESVAVAFCMSWET